MPSTNIPEPIPLRTLTLLLNYERITTDPRFQGSRLFQSSIADPTMLKRMTIKEPRLLSLGPPSIITRQMHSFAEFKEPATKYPSVVAEIHPDASSAVKNLSFANRDLIYHHSRGHDGCFKAIGLFAYFFALCDPAQMISIQVKDEKPLLVDPSTRIVFKAYIVNPKLSTLCSGPRGGSWMVTGSKNHENHVILAFPHPIILDQLFIVDMTRMQYGEAGRGSFGEHCFLGTLDDYLISMKAICGEIQIDYIPINLEGQNSKLDDRLKKCALKAWERWNGRKEKGWCAYCGRGGENLLRCAGCDGAEVLWCCVEHKTAGWELHQYNCERREIKVDVEGKVLSKTCCAV